MENSSIAGNLDRVRARVRKLCIAIGRDPSGIKIVGVSKTFPSSAVNEAVKAGLNDIGENKVQEGIKKIVTVSPRPVWHFIGRLQKNKAGKAAEFFDIIQSVEDPELAERLSSKAGELGKLLTIFLQLNSTGEIQKGGFSPAGIFEFADKIIKLPGLEMAGLMTVGPFTENVNSIRRSFSLTKEVYDKLKKKYGERFKWLSMGMSGDFEIALEYGANVLRIGTAIFGPRNNLTEGER